MATPTATVLATIVPTLTQTVEPGVLQVMQSGKWIADTLTHVLGTILGLVIGYGIGAWNEGKKKREEDRIKKDERQKDLIFYYIESLDIRKQLLASINRRRTLIKNHNIVSFDPLQVHEGFYQNFWQNKAIFTLDFVNIARNILDLGEEFNGKVGKFNNFSISNKYVINPDTNSRLRDELIDVLDKLTSVFNSFNEGNPRGNDLPPQPLKQPINNFEVI